MQTGTGPGQKGNVKSGGGVVAGKVAGGNLKQPSTPLSPGKKIGGVATNSPGRGSGAAGGKNVTIA